MEWGVSIEICVNFENRDYFVNNLSNNNYINCIQRIFLEKEGLLIFGY